MDCGSENALDQRVPVFSSTAALAGVPAFSVDDATTGLRAARFVVPPLLVKPTQFKLNPPADAWILNVCSPAVRLAVVVSVVHDCHPPVAAILAEARTVVPDLNWTWPPPGALATLKVIVYDPAVETLTR
jgi:hypothetical protein